MDYEQMDLFEGLYEKPSLPKHIRLIELFAGIGAQAKALEILGADFEHWRTCEWSWQSITAYNVIHLGGKVADTSNLTYDEVLSRIEGVSNDYNKPMTMKQLKAKGEKWARELLGRMITNNNVCPNVSKLHAKDLDIRERESHTYILTYSFPCQDLSNAGLLKGMEKGSGTRSGLLWEVERILDECKQDDTLPQALVMENVPLVCGGDNLKPWNEWLDKLHQLGYTSYYRILNAKDFGIPQNRKRCFMVSILGEYAYSFPKKQPLRYVLKDFIKKNVDESYFLSEEQVANFKKCKKPSASGIVGTLNKYGFSQADNVYSTERESITILAKGQGTIGHQMNILVEDNGGGRLECVNYTFQQRKRIYSSNGIAPCVTTTEAFMPSIEVNDDEKGKD